MPADNARSDALFGAVKEQDGGQAGRITVTDGAVTGAQWARLDHVSLDRFTQGPLDHHLFSEAPLYKGTLQFDLSVDTAELAPESRRAFDSAVRDLLNGRLGIGGGGSRGHGFCTGQITWSDGGQWLEAR